jgi:hypothetical protein
VFYGWSSSILISSVRVLLELVVGGFRYGREILGGCTAQSFVQCIFMGSEHRETIPFRMIMSNLQGEDSESIQSGVLSIPRSE